MEFLENDLYHIYNRGNNKQRIFFKPDNYLFFLNKVRKYIQPHCDILAWCLMPNHFHFLIYSDHRTIKTKLVSGLQKNAMSEGFRVLLSSYTQAINKQNNTTGSLFQQNTKAKLVAKNDLRYATTCFHYIHQNPIQAKLVVKMEDWAYSSFIDYCNKRNETLTNKDAAQCILQLNMRYFYEDSYRIINENSIRDIY